MNRMNLITMALLMMTAALPALTGGCAQNASLGKEHPVPVSKVPVCSDCHTGWRASLSHTPGFGERHRFFASQQRQACQLCHRDSFCSDCHARTEELKPSEKYKDSPERTLPHRGDYLTQHKIDGRINPASCFPCHGRQNNERCKTCHR
jgi:hypothetical protein